MARKTGQFNYPYNYEVKLTAPLDSRVLVDTVDSLINSTTWTDSDGGIYIYNGLLVSVTENNSVYMLTDADNYTNIESWKKINDDTVVLDYIVNVTYSELVELRDNNQLVPGQSYRIINYVTTTTQENTKSAKHNFDIIVKALSNNTLSENARVCRCFNSKRDHGVENTTSDLYNWPDVNNWFAYGTSDGGPTLPSDAIEFMGNSSVSTQIGTKHITSNSKIRITLLGKTSDKNAIRGFGAALIQNNTIIDIDFGSGSEFYLQLPSGYSDGSYGIRFYAYGTTTELIGGVDDAAGACAESFDATSHFNDSNLGAWEIKYSLDNDTNRFAWADTVNGKGVIYYMKDEFGNEAYYDFKNIKFNCSIFENYPFEYAYTFSDVNGNDLSLSTAAHENKINPYVSSRKQTLNHTIFIGNNIHSNALDENNYKNIIYVNGCYYNNIGNSFQNNNIASQNSESLINFHNNTIGNLFKNNRIRAEFNRNYVGNTTTSCDFFAPFAFNEIGNNSLHIDFNYPVSYCKFGSYIQYCVFNNTDAYQPSVSEMKWCTIGDGLEGAQYIPCCQKVTFEDRVLYNSSENWHINDVILNDGTKLVEQLVQQHEDQLYVCSVDDGYAVFRYKNTVSEINLGTFDNIDSVSSKASEIDICSNQNITRMSFKIDNDSRKYANGFIEQFISGGPYTVNNTELYYIVQTLYFDGLTQSRQIIYKFIDGIKTIHGVGNWYKIIDHDNSNIESPILYSKSSEVVNTSSEQTITGVKHFNNNININEKSIISSNIDSGEMKILQTVENKTSKGFILKTDKNSDEDVLPFQILTTCGTGNTIDTHYYKYDFPKKSGTVALSTKINGTTYNTNLDSGIIDLGTGWTKSVKINGEQKTVAGQGMIDLGTGYTKTKSVTYSELVELRNNSQLIPGQLYRITDYVTTTTQENTKSAEHQFDILVEALTDSILSENVKVYKESDYVPKLTHNMPAANEWEPTLSTISADDELNQLLKLIYGKDADLNNLTDGEKQRVRRASFTRTIEKGILEIEIRLNDEQTNDVTCLGANIIQNNKVIYSNYKKILINSSNNTIKYQLHVPSNDSYIIQIFAYCNENFSAGSDLTLNAYSCDNFINNDLNAWEIKYCLDNDTSRFAWADPDNGKGVIYYMKDEFNNEAWYDFKNIMFLRDTDWFTSNPNFTAAGNITQNTYFYTFSRVNGMVVDDSLGTGAYPTSDNHLGRNTATITKLNNTIFIGNGAFNNVLADGHGNNTIGVNIKNNIIGHNFTDNIINKNFQYNTIKEEVSKNHIWGSFFSNIIESNCSDNRFLGNVDNCLFKQYYEKNNFTGDTLSQCTFGIANNWISDMPSMKNVTFSNNCITGSNSIYLDNLITTNNISLLTELNDIYNTNNNFTYSIYLTNNNRYIILSPNIDKNNEIKITYSELFELRNNSQLVPGQLYRITDYVTTTTQTNTKSAKYNFDIIVTALNNNTLSENARVCRCLNSKRDHGVETNSDIFNYTDENDWYNYGHAYGGPTLPDDVLKLKNEANIDVVSTDYGKIQISDVNQYLNKIFRITLQGTDVNGNKIRGFGATLIKNAVIQDFDFGFRDEFYLRLPESATTGEYVLRFYAIGTTSDINGGYAGARAEVFDSTSNFNNSDLNTWEIKYSLDNDTSRFTWADPDNGKGVIYYMKDDKNNECPYDFKNITFDSNGKNYFTFSYDVDGVIYDGTVHNGVKYCYDNIIKPYIRLSGEQILNNIKFINTSFVNACNNNTFGIDCYNNTFGSNCYNNTFINAYNNTFGNSCNSNSFESSCSSNTFGNDCDNNSFGNNCYSNTFGNYCKYNLFRSECGGNTFINHCKNNTLGEHCQNNSFGSSCTDNAFGNNCTNNTFENNCQNNSFGSSCTDNAFGNYCTNNSFGSSCTTNTFGNYCTNNSFGSSCDNNAFGDSCTFNTFGDSCDRNAFENFCTSNTFGKFCANNTFIDNCTNNTFGGSCKNNTFTNNCDNNTFGGSCTGNAFGDNCDHNTFGSGCTTNTFGNTCTGNTIDEYFQGNIVGISFCNNKIGAKYSFNKFGNNCNNLHIIEKQTSDINSPLQNFNFGAGLTGEIELKGKNIRNRLFETKVCYNSNGDIVQYCEADLVMVNPYEDENNTVSATTTEDSIELTGNIEVGEDEISITGDNIKIINIDNNNYEIIIE